MLRSITTSLMLFAAGLSIPFQLNADTIKLIEGTKLEGEIVSEDERTVTINNSYGSFVIRRSDITSIQWTEKRLDIRANGEISVSGAYFYIFGEIGNRIPYGYSFHMALDQGLDALIEKRHSLIPAFRIEGGYINFKKEYYTFSGFNAAGGFVWSLPLSSRLKGSFVFAILNGISFLEFGNSQSGIRASSNTYTALALAGYKRSFGDFSLFINTRYIYIYDKEVFFQTVGGEMGFSYNAW